MIITLDRPWQSGEFWRAVLVLIETIKAEMPTIEEKHLEQAVLRDWLALSVPIGRA